MSASALAPLRGRVRDYYTGKIGRHGPTPAGVDWSCAPTQELRFVQLLRPCNFHQGISLNDLGCGYGALVGFIARRHRAARVNYLGIDLSPAMIEHAKILWQKKRGATFCVGERSPRSADYSVASGIFNVSIDEPRALWETFVEETLTDLSQTSRIGFAVNFLAVLPEGMEGSRELYRCTPARWVAFCERHLGMRVQVLDCYGMREFTLFARH